MTWSKRGLIYRPIGSGWRMHSALQPTPLLIDGGRTIRVYVGMRDADGVSRVGFVDLDAANPASILGVSELPALDIGQPGTFDDNGVVPCAVIERDGAIHLYYAGYALPQKVRFHVFGGLAISRDGGTTFQRYSEAPVLDRTDGELFFRVLHSIRFDGERWQAWYGAGSSFEEPAPGARTRAVYNIRYMESADGIHFPDSGEVCIDIRGDEHRVGRPYVVVEGTRYEMYFAAATRADNYRLTYAESGDGRTWNVLPDRLGLAVSENDWDSEMMSYPSVIRAGDRTYLFYNGNDYGRDGFGFAVQES